MAEANLVVWAELVRKQIDRLKAEYPELEDDAELLADMAEGSTSFDYVLNRITMAFLDKKSLREANAALQEELQKRGVRFGRRMEALKALATSLMQHAEKRTAVLPAATLSITKGRARVVIDSLSDLPQGFTKTEVVPLKAEILATLQTEGTLPGAHLEQGEPSLSIRTK